MPFMERCKSNEESKCISGEEHTKRWEQDIQKVLKLNGVLCVQEIARKPVWLAHYERWENGSRQSHWGDEGLNPHKFYV